jgi:uncharacterized membrane protein YjjP (DUF1212 family)
MMPSPQLATHFLMELGKALHRFGTPAHRLELALAAVAERLGLRAEIFTTPTQLMVGVGEGATQRAIMSRVSPGEVNLEKLAALDELAEAVVRGDVGIDQGIDDVRRITEAAPRYGTILTTLAFSLVSAPAARFFGGGVAEIAIAGGIGLVIGLMAHVFGRSTAGNRVYELCAAFFAATVAHAATQTGASISYQVPVLAGLIVLVPGLTLTIAINEVATGNLVSGTARLMAAAVVFLEIAFGVALGERIMTRLWGPATAATSVGLPGWTEPVALLIATVGITILFRAHPRATPGIILAGVAGFYSARMGAWLLGPELGAFVGGFAVAAGSNVYARIANRPAMIPLVPGILLLVPGSLGFRSLSSLLERDVVTGIDTAFTMILVAVSLVAGLLMANATISPRREL